MSCWAAFNAKEICGHYQYHPYVIQKAKDTWNGHFRLFFEMVLVDFLGQKSFNNRRITMQHAVACWLWPKTLFSKEVIPASSQDTIMSSEDHLEYHDVITLKFIPEKIWVDN